MITLIHGDDITASRNYFLDIKIKHKGAPSFSGESVTLTDLAQALQGDGLFEEIKSVYIEELFGKKKKGRELDAMLDFLNRESKTHAIYLWEKKPIPQTSLKTLTALDIKLFKLPQELFRFLDAVRPGNAEELITLFHAALKTNEPEMLLYMLTRQIRLLLSQKDPETTIDEITRLAPWQKSKLKKQADKFKASDLLNLYRSLFLLDVKQKTGTGTSSLSSSIDFLLLAL